MEISGAKFGLSPMDLVKVLSGQAGDYLQDVHSGKYNYERMHEYNPDSGLFPKSGPEWNYKNMPQTLEYEKERELEEINKALGLPQAIGSLLQ